MLRKLNERIQGVVAWLVVILIGITFTLFGVDYYLQSHQTTDSKAVVNDYPLSMQAFEINYRRARATNDNEQMTTVDDEKKLQNQVLDQMITNEVLVQAAGKNGFDVSSDQLNTAMLSIPQFQEDGHFSVAKYQQALSAALYTQFTFQNQVKQGMLLNQQRFAFIGSSFALPAEIERFVSLYMQNRDFDYLTVPMASFEKEIQISSEAVADYYKKHKKEFMTLEQVSLDYITLSLRDIKGKIKVSNDEAKRYYEENQNNYLTPARWKVAHILFAVPKDANESDVEQIKKKADDSYQRLQKNPEQFDKLVSTMSDDKLSIPSKGELPWITAGQNDYNKLLSDLTKPGQISVPEKTKHGYEIFKLVAYKPVIIKSFDSVESTIKEQIINEKAQSQYSQALEQLSDLSYQYPDSLNSVADVLKLKIEKTSPFSKESGTDIITKNKQIINAVFSRDILELGTNSEPIQLDNDTVVVARVNHHWPEKEQSLTTVQDKITKILVKKIAESKAKEVGISLINSVEEKKQKELIHSNHLTWKSIAKSTRDNTKVEAQINDMAFNLLQPGHRGGLVLPNGNYVVVRLQRINDGKLSDLDREQQDSLIRHTEANYGMMDYDLYVNQLMNHAQIVRH